MIVNEEYCQDLIKIAKKYKYSAQFYPADENGEPKETYLEHLSLMYDLDIVETMLQCPIMPKTISIKTLSKKVKH